MLCGQPFVVNLDQIFGKLFLQQSAITIPPAMLVADDANFVVLDKRRAPRRPEPSVQRDRASALFPQRSAPSLNGCGKDRGAAHAHQLDPAAARPSRSRSAAVQHVVAIGRVRQGRVVADDARADDPSGPPPRRRAVARRSANRPAPRRPGPSWPARPVPAVRSPGPDCRRLWNRRRPAAARPRRRCLRQITRRSRRYKSRSALRRAAGMVAVGPAGGARLAAARWLGGIGRRIGDAPNGGADDQRSQIGCITGFVRANQICHGQNPFEPHAAIQNRAICLVDLSTGDRSAMSAFTVVLNECARPDRSHPCRALSIGVLPPPVQSPAPSSRRPRGGEAGRPGTALDRGKRR